MPEVILPCPACGAVENESDKFGLSYRLGVQIVCHKCGMYGPVAAEDFNEAVGKWNALPRALTWTHEPPKVAGWYWVRQHGEAFDIMQHYHQADIDSGFVNELRLKQYAGPIAPPVEG